MIVARIGYRLSGVFGAGALFAVLLPWLIMPRLTGPAVVAQLPEPFDLVVLVDVSESIDLAPNGWLARAAVNLVVDSLKLVYGSYSSNRITVVPFSTTVDQRDLESIANASIDGVFDVPLTRGTDFAAAFAAANELFSRGGTAGLPGPRRQIVMLITDGEPDVGTLQTGSEHVSENLRFLETNIRPAIDGLIAAGDRELIILGISPTPYESFWNGRSDDDDDYSGYGDGYHYIPIESTDDLKLLLQDLSAELGIPQVSGWVSLKDQMPQRRTSVGDEVFVFFPAQQAGNAPGQLTATETSDGRVRPFPYGGDILPYVIGELPAGEWEFTLQGAAEGEILMSSFILPTATWTPIPSSTTTATPPPTATGLPTVTPTSSPTLTVTPTPTATPRPVLPSGTADEFIWGQPTLMPQVPRHSEPLEIVIPAAISDTVRSIAKAILLVDGEVHSEIQLTREGESFHGRFDPLFCDRPWPRGCNVEIRVVAEVDLDDGTGYDVPLEDIKGQVALPGRWTISFIGALLLLLLAYLLLHLLFKSLGKWLRTKLIKDVLPKLEKGQSPVPVRFQQPFLVYLRSLELHTVHAQLQNVQSGEFSPADKKDKLASIGEELSSLMQKSKEELDNLAMNPSEHSRAGLSAAYFAAFLEEDVVKALDWARQLADHVGNDERVAAALCLNHLCRTGNWEHYYTLEAEKRFATDIIDSAGQAYSARIAT